MGAMPALMTVPRIFQPLFAERREIWLTSRLFLRLLACIYFIAFASLSVQITGLAGPEGILPFTDVLDYVRLEAGWWGWFKLPTLFWLDASDLALYGATLAGCVFSILLLFGVLERLATIALFVLYLSLYHAGQIFLSFQWDSLLLEAGFLAIFLISGPTFLLLLLYEWLLFRFRFMSGLSKLLSDDPVWANFTVLDHYFETQPLPHIGSWYAHHLPHWLHSFGVGFTFFTELIVPFLIFMPRRYRIVAALITIFMQLLIIATSNHAFVNLLVIVLCILLLDDRLIERILPSPLIRWLGKNHYRSGGFNKLAVSIVGVLILFVSTTSYYMFSTRQMLPESIVKFDTAVQMWGIGHIYHIFPTMQTQRQELIIQGSLDGKNWKEYEFRYKPGVLDKKPAFIVPHHPRLDWMMWFVPTQDGRQLYWFNKFQNHLKKGTPQVLALLKTNPFPDKPPKFMRVKVWEYHFTSPQEHRETGHWWKRKYLGLFPYVPPRIP